MADALASYEDDQSLGYSWWSSVPSFAAAFYVVSARLLRHARVIKSNIIIPTSRQIEFKHTTSLKYIASF